MSELQIGDAAPAVDLALDGDRSVALASLRGKAVVLYFYPKADTPACTEECIAFSRMKADFAAAGAEVIGISPDEAAKNAKFKTKHTLSVDLASDPSNAVSEAFGVWVEKSMYGKKYMGVERSTFLISAEGKLAGIWRKVKVPGHAEAVLEAVKAL
ncbi:redoxin domain-containing protein [Microvirga tunisiensis]|uniref:Redoxin domain-containing protein n=2 Tax=Pannonibacter tanglangensis TaxID=2750084 RepID=A0ABW9ZBX8_9HYPH|nr:MULTISPECIES: peroxiredoxin [unclassified Pannonibacter]NBN62350.1 redoxin domain-containing protein [Pannonibacter sp. XCT-34]NBN78017.1 redoxin domain-containing protein [Pannonibacter sp. XCT-53]